jgi:replication-associated recombination protein RarA
MIHLRHQPQTWTDIVGQDKAVRLTRRIVESPAFDRGSFWIDCAGTNNSGVGKTSIAWVVARSLADDFFINELPGAKLDKAAVARIEESAHLCAWGKGWRVWIVNESHAMTDGAIDLLLTFLECLPRHCAMIFTTTKTPDVNLFGEADGPLLSRCHRITLTNQGLCKPFASRIKSILQAEGRDGQSDAWYQTLVKEHRNNFRAALLDAEARALDAEPTTACVAG